MGNIRRIESTTQPNFYDSMLNMLLRKVIERERSRYFICYERAKLLTLLYLLHSCLYDRHELSNLVFANQISIDTHALAKCMQIRLRIESCMNASLTQNSFNESRRRTFSFRASD